MHPLHALLLLAALLVASLADKVPLIDTRPVLGGFDVVEYQNDLNPDLGGRSGLPEFAYNFSGFQFWFLNKANRDRFVSDPWKYAPQFGGFSALDLVRQKSPEWPWGRLHMGPPVGPDTGWAVVKGALYLNLFSELRNEWLKEVDVNIALATERWIDLWGSLQGGPFNTHCFGADNWPVAEDLCDGFSGDDYTIRMDAINVSMRDSNYDLKPSFDGSLTTHTYSWPVHEVIVLILVIGLGLVVFGIALFLLRLVVKRVRSNNSEYKLAKQQAEINWRKERLAQNEEHF